MMANGPLPRTLLIGLLNYSQIFINVREKLINAKGVGV
jgi:hypothetical protein